MRAPMAENIKNDSFNKLTGKLLLATPGMTDPRFERAVILMCAHDEHGAMGLVVNNVLKDVAFDHILETIDLKSDIVVNITVSDITVMNGGPVEGSRGFMLHSKDFIQDDTIRINNDFHVTGTVDALEAVAKGEGPDDMLFILGYAGWQAGQLESELKQNSWLVSEPDLTLLFGTKPEEKWQRAVQKLGFDPAMLSTEMGRA